MYTIEHVITSIFLKSYNFIQIKISVHKRFYSMFVDGEGGGLSSYVTTTKSI